MNTLSLALFNQDDATASQEAGVRYEQPVDTIPAVKRQESVGYASSPQQTLETQLKRIFPTERELTRIEKARQIMGDLIVGMADEELEKYLTEFQFLLNAWLDQYEKQLFEGRTLEQLLKEG